MTLQSKLLLTVKRLWLQVLVIRQPVLLLGLIQHTISMALNAIKQCLIFPHKKLGREQIFIPNIVCG